MTEETTIANDDQALGTQSTWNKVKQRFFRPVDISSLVVMRIAFGLIMLWEVFRYFDKGWISRYWMEPQFYFTYNFFHWVQPWGGDGMYYHFLVLGILAIFIAIGFYYRISTVLFFLGFTYIFLLDKAPYLNHFYLISLISFLLIFIPAHRSTSVDAYFDPNLRADSVPAWTLWIIQAQMAIVYVYGGIAKLNADWLRTEPMRSWLENRVNEWPLVGQFFVEDPVVYFFVYGGLFFDLFIVPFVLWKRTRIPAFIVVLFFHIMNARMFSIGIFPWFAIAATTLFFPADWARKIFNLPRYGRDEPTLKTFVPKHVSQYAALSLFAVYISLQLLVPLRHYAIPGNVSWTEDGHRFAWHMKLRDKNAQAMFYVTDLDSGTVWAVDPDSYLSSRQARKMATRPDMLLQFAHYLDDEMANVGYDNVKVTVDAVASLNGRAYQTFVDPELDLSEVEEPFISLARTDYIIPIEEPFPSVNYPAVAVFGASLE